MINKINRGIPPVRPGSFGPGVRLVGKPSWKINARCPGLGPMVFDERGCPIGRPAEGAMGAAVTLPEEHSSSYLELKRRLEKWPRYSIFSNIRYYPDLSQAERFDLALTMAARQPLEMMTYCGRFALTDHYYRYGLARAMILYSEGQAVPEYLVEDDFSEAERVELAVLGFGQSSLSTVFRLVKYGIRDRISRLRCFQAAVMNDPTVVKYLERFLLFNKPVPDKVAAGGLDKVFHYFREQAGDFDLKEMWFDGLIRSKDVRRRDVKLKLLTQLLLETESSLAGLTDPETELARYLISKMIGLGEDFYQGPERSCNAKRELSDKFYVNCLGLQRALPFKVFGRLRFAPELLASRDGCRKLALFVHDLRLVKNILGQEADRLEGIISGLPLGPVVDGRRALDEGNIDEVNKVLERIFRDKFCQVFDLDLSSDQIASLESKWGSLDILFTLAARYRSRPQWVVEIPVLGRIIEAVLEDNYALFKYQGDSEEERDKVQRQLAVLTDKASWLGWIENRQITTVLEAESDGRKPPQSCILFAVTSDDPKLSLMMADLTSPVTCMTSLHGDFIDMLPAYALDANIKLVMAFLIEEKDFARRTDYVEACRLIKSGVRPEFDHARLRWRIGDIEIQLKYAQCQSEIKLGSAPDNKAAVFVEKPYVSDPQHWAAGQALALMAQVVDRTAEACGARQGDRVSFPASRNPRGIYSDYILKRRQMEKDLMGPEPQDGVQDGPYTVGP